MKTVEEVRRERLAMLKSEAGSLAALNERAGLNRLDSTFSQILNGAKNSRTGKSKEMGSKMARDLEAACGKEVGWMDTDPALLSGSLYSPEVTQLASVMDTIPQPERERVLILCRQVLEMARESVAKSNAVIQTDENDKPLRQAHPRAA